MEGADKVYSLDYYERNEDQINQEISAVKSQVSFVRKRLECMFYGSVIVTILFLAINGAILGHVSGPKNDGSNHESENILVENVNQTFLTGQLLEGLYWFNTHVINFPTLLIFYFVSVCADGWVPNNLTAAASGLCYKHVPSPMNWTAARRECEEAAPHHGDLASVPDEATNLFLMSLTEAEAWTGGFRENNLWQWSDGSAWRYQAWHPRQPDNPNTQDHQRF